MNRSLEPNAGQKLAGSAEKPRPRGRLFIGTSGWAYRNWRGVFYPQGLPAQKELNYLANHLPTVEINGTFYRLARPENCDAWRAAVPADFVFAIKGGRYITHMLKLRDVEVALANFFAQGILRLGRQLGPLLWQLPAVLKFDASRASEFLSLLPRRMTDAEALAKHADERVQGRAATSAPDGRRMRLRHVLEARHESWFCNESLQLLKAHDVALVTADTAGKFPLSFERTASFAYLRLHGSSVLYTSRYTDQELADWAKHIRRWSQSGCDVYVYFDNDAKVYAPSDAMRLCTLLDPQLLRRGGGAPGDAIQANL